MKRFARILLAAAVVLAVTAVTVMAAVPASAASAGKTIYIAETAKGNGSGSSAANAMGSVEEIGPSVPGASTNWEKYTGESYYKNSALYRAASELVKTGGKIVLVEDVSIDFTKTSAGAVKEDGTYTARQNARDFIMPTYGNNTITITNGDYNGRLVMTEGSQLILGGKTIFEDLDFVAHDGSATADNAKKDFTICCNGYETVFGEGLTNKSYSGDIRKGNATERAATYGNRDYFIQIVGGSRYGTISRGADITVNSGTWGYIAGGNKNNNGDKQYGDINMVLNDGLFLGSIVGGGSYVNTCPTFGDVYMELNGGTYKSHVHPVSRAALGYDNNKAFLRITGGTFDNGNAIYKNLGGTYAVDLTVDLSGLNQADSRLTQLLSKAGDAKVMYPAVWAEKLTVNSYSKIAFMGEPYDAESIEVTVTYNANAGNAVETFKYTPENKGFNVTLDTSAKGTKVLKVAYGSKSVSKVVTVLNVPQPTFEGAQVALASDNLGKLRLVGSMSIELTGGVTLDESGSKMPYGFYAVVNTGVTKSFDLDMLETYNKIELDGTKFRTEGDTLGVYNNSVKRTFGAELTGLSLKDYDTNISIVSYVKFKYDGVEYVRYSPIENKTVLGVANAAYASQLESDEGKAFLKTNIIDKYAAYKSNKNNMVDQASADAMRTEVVNAYKAMANYTWTPSETFKLTTGTKTNTYTAGTTYKGIPYVNGRKATLSEFTANITTVKGTNGSTNLYTGPVRGVYNIFGVPQYDESGKFTGVDTTNAQIVSTKYADAFANGKVITDHLSEDMLYISDFFPAVDYNAIYNAWNVVGTNEVWPVGLSGAIPNGSSGVVTVGNYTVSGTDTLAICQANGTSVMYAAYAACKPGDVLVNVSTKGRSLHMVTVASNGTASATTTLKRSYTSETLNSTTKSHFVLDSSVSFQSLYNSGFIPVTIPELKNGLKTPTTTILTGFDGAATFKDGKVIGRIDSNRTIVSVNVTLGIGSGYIFDETHYYTTQDTDMNTVHLDEFDFSRMLPKLVAGKTYQLRVVAEIAGDEGKTELLNYSYTEPKNNTAKFAVVYTAANTPSLKISSDLQQSVIDNMWEQYNGFEWTPSHNFKYVDTNPESDAFCPSSIYEKGVKYRGILYSNMRSTFAEFKNILTSNNVVNIDTTLTVKDGYYQVDWSHIMGNHCSAAMFNAYQQSTRVSASEGSRYAAGLISAGTKDIFGEFAKFFVGHTASATEAYGDYAMYEAMAKWQKGDYMYNNSDGGGHTRMVSDVVVVRNSATGKIDPDKSYVLMCEQTDTLISDRIDTNKYYLYVGNLSNGSKYMQFIKPSDTTTPKPTGTEVYETFAEFYGVYGMDTTWWLNNKYTFRNLFGTGYNAFAYRPVEFVANATEDIYVGVNRIPTIDQLRTKSNSSTTVIESNYPIVSMYVKITNTKTNAVTTVPFFRAQTNLYRYDLAQKAADINTALNGLGSGTYKVSVITELAKCEIETISLTYTK